MDFLLSSESNIWGLFQKDTKTSLPLKSLDISVRIIHNISRVRYTQTYQNNTNSLLETEFFFPISPDACFDSFEAKFNDTTIKGIIKEKEQAKEQYNETVEAGNIAAYSEIVKETGDLMKVLIGNIPQSSKVSVTYSYIEKMEISLNRFWCFRLFSSFTSRYNGDLNEYINRDITLLAKYPTVTKSEAYPWTIEVEVQSPSQIQFLESPSHDIVTKYGNEKHTCTVTLDSKQKYKPNKDFVLLYSNGKENEIGYVMTPFENDDYCAMVTLMADFDKAGVHETYNNFVKVKQSDSSFEMNRIKGEYIFLLDRSGSMKGDRIKMAKASLQLFLKSLPRDSYYNVVSFGDYNSFLHPSSQRYSEENLEKTGTLIERLEANLGGTEIYTALQRVYKTPLKEDYPRFVFLLTDGDVTNTQKVLDLITQNSQKNRTFTIGIGNGCSVELIKKGAICGRGKYEFVQDNKEIYAKVISLLDAALRPGYLDISLQANNFDAVVKSVTPNPSTIPFLMSGQHITFFLFIRKDAFAENWPMALELRFYDSRIQDYRSVKIMLDSDKAIKNDMIPKLAIHDMIKRLEEQKATNLDEKQILWSDKAEVTQALLELSVKYGVLCKETAFFCEIAQTNNNTKLLRPIKVVIPTVVTQVNEEEDDDCNSGGGFFDDDDNGGCSVVLNSVEQQTNYQQTNVYQPAAATACAYNSYDYEKKEKKYEEKVEEADTDMNLCLFGDEDENDSVPTIFFTPSSNDQLTNNYLMSAAAPVYSSQDEKEKEPPISKKQVEEVKIEDNNVINGFNSDHNNYDSRCLPKKPRHIKNSTPISPDSYLEIIMKQTFSGCWDPNDQAILTVVLANGKLSQVPEELDGYGSPGEKVWLTVLVLLWLEVVFHKEKQAWRLIHQKGCDWLKNQGVNYEQVKDLGRSTIRV